MSYHQDTRAACEAIQAAARKLLGYPKRGRHIGGGRHVTIAATPGLGWTTEHGNPRAHPTIGALWAYPVDDELQTALDNADKRAALSAAELTALDAARASAGTLGEDWDAPVDVVGDGR